MRWDLRVGRCGGLGGIDAYVPLLLTTLYHVSHVFPAWGTAKGISPSEGRLVAIVREVLTREKVSEVGGYGRSSEIRCR